MNQTVYMSFYKMHAKWYIHYTNERWCACACHGSGRGCTGWKPVIFAEFLDAISRLTLEQK